MAGSYLPGLDNFPSGIDEDRLAAGLLAIEQGRHSQQSVTEAVLVSGVDATLGEDIVCTLTANRVLGRPLNGVAGQRLQLVLTQGGAGNFTLTAGTGVTFSNFALNATAGAVTTGSLVCLSPTSWVVASNPPSGKVTVWGNGVFDPRDPTNPNGAAVVDGVTDNTSAILGAFTACGTTGQMVLGPGAWVYNGAGLDASTYNIKGAGNGVVVTLGASSYFLKSAVAQIGLDLSGIQFSGGLGAIYFTYTGNNVQREFIVDRCYFNGYTQTAIGHLSADMPYWKITRCIFYGNATSTIGVALAGLTDQSSITDCAFLLNKVHVKAGLGGNNLIIERCDFIQFAAGNTRVFIWAVPNSSSTNSGTGLLVTGCKLGSENQGTGDYKIVYADEAAGTDFTTKLPNLGADSTGFISGHVVEKCKISGANASSQSLVYSTTPNVWGGHYADGCTIDGTVPNYFLEFRTVPIAGDRLNADNLFGPVNWPSGEESIPIPVSNAQGVGFLMDPHGMLSAGATQPSHLPGMGDGIEYAALLNVLAPNYLSGGGSLVGATDSLGGADAATVTAGAAQSMYASPTTMTLGVPVYIEFELKSGGATPLANVSVEIQLSGLPRWRRRMPLPTNWRRYRFLFMPRTTGVDALAFVNYSGSSGTFLFGRVRMYHAREPYSNHFAKIASLGSAPPVASALGANVTSVTPTGTNMVGSIAVVMAGALAANTKIATLTWATTYGGTAPIVLLVNQTSGVGLASVNFYQTPSTGASVDLFCNQALAAGTYTVIYLAVARGTN